MAAQDLAIRLSINADTAAGRAALQAFAEQMGQIPDAADTASKKLKGAFQQIRDDINAAFTFSAGQLMADGLKSGIEAVASFVGDSKDKFLDYETALTGVAKTTGMKGQELKGLSDQLRQSAIDLKGLGEDAATQMAHISEIAGQLGIAADKIKTGNFQAATQEIAGFSETIAKAKIALPEFTGGVEEVATSTAKVIQLHGQTAASAEAILSTYNEMSNTTAANAKQIAAFMESFTMAPQLKIDIQTAAGLAATFVSMGQDANDAATRYQAAITALLKGTEGTIDAVNTAMTGSTSAQKELEAIVGRSKTSSEDFYTYFKQAVAVDSVSAVNALIDAIGAMPDSVTQSQTSTEAFGQVGARVMNTLIGHTDTLKQNIDNASEAYKSATSIQEEFETAISTQGTAFAELKTKVEDIKIEIGENLVKALGDVARSDVSPAIDQFSNWLKTSQDAKSLFENLPTVISGLSSAAVGAAKLAVGAYNAIVEAANFWGNALVDVEAQIRKVIGAIDDTVKKAKELSDAVFQNETAIGIFENITNKIYGVDAAEQQLTESVQETTTAVDELGKIAYGFSTYPDMTAAIVETTGSQEVLTERVAVTTEQVAELGATALESFSAFSEAVSGIGDNLSGLGGSLGDLGGLLGIKELGGLGGFLGDISKYTQLPSLLGDIGGQFSSLISSAGSLGGLLGGGGLTGILSGLGGTLSGGLGGAISMVSGAFGGLGSTVAGLGSSILSGLGGAVSSVTGLFGGLGGAVSGVLPMLGPIGLAGGAIALAFNPLKGLFSSIFGEAQSEGNKANEVWRHYVGDVIDSSGQMEGALTHAYKTFSSSGNDYIKFLQNAGPATQALHDELGGLDGVTLSGLIGAMEAAGVSSEKSAQVALQQVAAFAELGYSAEEARAKIDEMIAATQGAGEEGESTSSVFDAQTAKAQALGTEIDALSGSLGDVTSELSGTGKEGGQTGAVFDQAGDKADGLEGRIEQLSHSLGDVTSELTGTSSTGRDTGAVFDIAADAAHGLDHTVSSLSSEVSHLTHDMSETGVKALASSNMFEVAGHSADHLSGDMNSLGNQAAAASHTLDDINAILRSIPEEKRLTFVVEQQGDIPSLAAGGAIGLTGLAIVNERGPEIAHFPGGSLALLTQPGPVLGAFPVGTEIIPHSQAMQILRDNPAIPRMAEGGTIRGTAALTIGTIEVHNHFTEAPTTANLERLTEQMSRSLAQKIRRML